MANKLDWTKARRYQEYNLESEKKHDAKIDAWIAQAEKRLSQKEKGKKKWQ